MTKSRYAIACVSLTGALLINLAAMYLRTDAQANLNRAGLVVQYPDGSVAKRCVTFAEPEISGYDLLRRANVQVVADVASGGNICKIGGTGCNFPAQQCFCQCQDLNSTCIYWIYYFEGNGAWKYSSLGASLQKVTNGSVNGWAYGAGGVTSGGVQPPYLTLDQICGAVAAAVTAPATAPTAAPIASTPLPAPTAPPVRFSATPPAATSAPATSTSVAAATPTPSATSVATTASTASAAATSTLAPISTPTTSPAPSVTAPVPPSSTALAPTNTPDAVPDASSSAGAGGYVAFGAIVIGLLVILAITRLRAGRNNP